MTKPSPPAYRREALGRGREEGEFQIYLVSVLKKCLVPTRYMVDRIYGESIRSGNDTFNGNSFFRTYVLALATAEASLFIDHLEPTIAIHL
jgi:hypothetical protein